MALRSQETKEETALVVHRNPQDEADVFNQATPDDLVLPIIKLVQGVSRKADKKKAGEFWLEVADEYKPELRVAALSLQRTRSLFLGDNFDQPPTCSSDDGIKPRQRVTVSQGKSTGPTCSQCPFARWGSAGENKRGQACRFSYSLLLQDLEDNELYIYRVGGAGIGNWKRYLTHGRMGDKPAYAVETIVRSQEKNYTRGAAYEPTFEQGRDLTADEVASTRQYALQYKGASLGVEEEVEPEVAPAYETDEDYYEEADPQPARSVQEVFTGTAQQAPQPVQPAVQSAGEPNKDAFWGYAASKGYEKSVLGKDMKLAKQFVEMIGFEVPANEAAPKTWARESAKVIRDMGDDAYALFLQALQSKLEPPIDSPEFGFE